MEDELVTDYTVESPVEATSPSTLVQAVDVGFYLYSHARSPQSSLYSPNSATDVATKERTS